VRDGESDIPGSAPLTTSLPYQITDSHGAEIARAACAALAMAMFRSALAEHPTRTLLLRHNGALIIERFA
jgi:hypothetical protein